MSVEVDEARAVVGFPRYKVDTNGTVWAPCVAGWKPMRSCSSGKNGYLSVSLRRDGKAFRCYVHRLVLEAFVGRCPDGMEARHFPDSSRGNCRLDNLSWGTKKQNADDKVTHGSMARGERQGLAKLTEDDVSQIRSLYAAGGISQPALARQFGVHQATIWRVLVRATWRTEVSSLASGAR